MIRLAFDIGSSLNESFRPLCISLLKSAMMESEIQVKSIRLFSPLRNPKINIEFNENARILSQNVKNSDKSTSIAYIEEKNKPNSVTYDIKLLNKKAEVQIELVVADHEEGKYKAEALGLGIKSRIITESKLFSVNLLMAILASGTVAMIFGISHGIIRSRKNLIDSRSFSSSIEVLRATVAEDFRALTAEMIRDEQRLPDRED